MTFHPISPQDTPFWSSSQENQQCDAPFDPWVSDEDFIDEAPANLEQDNQSQPQQCHFASLPPQSAPQPMQLGYYDLNHKHQGARIIYPRCPPNFQNTCPPFPAPDPSYKFQPFKSFDEFLYQVQLTPDLNNSYVAIPIPFMTRFHETRSQSFPLFGYFIHK